MDRTPAPGRWLYGLSILFMLAGIAAMVGLLVTFIPRLLPHQRVIVPGTIEIQADKAGTYTVFVEQIGNSVQVPPGLEVNVSPSSAVSLRDGGNSNYHINDRTGVSYLRFGAQEPGTYTVSGGYANGQAGPQVTLAIAREFTGTIFALVFGCVLAMGAGLGGGIVLLYWTCNRRRLSRTA